jgi:hypothetical protein
LFTQGRTPLQLCVEMRSMFESPDTVNQLLAFVPYVAAPSEVAAIVKAGTLPAELRGSEDIPSGAESYFTDAQRAGILADGAWARRRHLLMLRQEVVWPEQRAGAL